MSNRWTIKDINDTDDITFAMCILSERREMLNQEAPLAKKLKSAYHTLDDIRGGQPMTPGADGWGSMRERIYRAVNREYTIADIEHHVTEENHDLQGMTPDEVLADEEIMDQIYCVFEKCELGEDYWNAMRYSVEQGVKDVLSMRSEGDAKDE